MKTILALFFVLRMLAVFGLLCFVFYKIFYKKAIKGRNKN